MKGYLNVADLKAWPEQKTSRRARKGRLAHFRRAGARPGLMGRPVMNIGILSFLASTARP